MQIEWIGGTTFILKNSTGKRVLLDPVKSIIDLANFKYVTDVITSSTPYNSDDLKILSSTHHKIIDSPCSFTNDFLTLHGYITSKDAMNGIKRGPNIIYILEIDGLRFCHLGTIGHSLNDNLLSKLGNIDFLFIPIGGHFCLDGIDAAKVAYSINPRYVIPMYYRNSSHLFYLDGPHKFLSAMKNIITINDSSVQTINLASKERTVVLLLKNSLL